MADFMIQEDPGLKRRRALAEAMMSQGLQGGPVGHWMEGVGRVAQAWAGNKMAQQADTEQKARQQSAMDALSKALMPSEVTDPATGQVTKKEPSYDSLAAAMSQNPDLAPLAMNLRMTELQNKAKTQAELEAALQKPTQVGDQLVIPKTKEVLFEGRQKAPEGMRYGPTGELEVIPNYVDMKSTIAAAGRPTNVTKIDVKTGESLAGKVGDIVQGTYEGAVAGVKLVDSSQRILKAAEQGNVIAGPAATLRLKGAQLADFFGVGGKDTKEKIANTRAIIRATAEQAVSARSMLGGQAQISNAEQELITRATSGDIDDLTIDELAQIAVISDRLGRQMYDTHAQKLQIMQEDPETKGLSRYYQPPEILPPYKGGSGQPPAGGQGGWGPVVREP